MEAIKLYLRTPFGKIHSRNPDIIELASQIGRTSGAVALKMANLAGLDPTMDRKGMSNASALDRRLWTDFLGHIESSVDGRPASRQGGFGEPRPSPFQFDHADRDGLDIAVVATRRAGQDFFRRMIVASYDERCALSDIGDRRLLVASHINRWADNKKRRLDPTNGICLNPLLERAFETGLIAFADDLQVLVASEAEPKLRNCLRERCSPSLRRPSRFLPDLELIRAHRERFGRSFDPVATVV